MSDDNNNMGRPRKYATEEERKEARRKQNRAYQKKYHRKVRKQRYHNDPEFREQVLKRERERYRSGKPNYKPKGLGAKAGKASAFAVPLPCRAGSSFRTKPVLPLDAMAAFIGISDKIMSEWVEAEKFPRPQLETKEGQRVYTVPQANALAAVLRRELKNRATFRTTDTKIILALRSEFRP